MVMNSSLMSFYQFRFKTVKINPKRSLHFCVTISNNPNPGLPDEPRCRYYDQRCEEMQNAPPLPPLPPVAPPPRSHPACTPFWSPPPEGTCTRQQIHSPSTMWGRSGHPTNQLFGPHVVQDPLSVLAVVTTLHDGEEQLGGVVLWKSGTSSNNTHLSIFNLLVFILLTWLDFIFSFCIFFIRSVSIFLISSTAKLGFSLDTFGHAHHQTPCYDTSTLTLSSSTRSILFLPRGLMSLRMRAMMMSMPLHSWVAMQF